MLLEAPKLSSWSDPVQAWLGAEEGPQTVSLENWENSWNSRKSLSKQLNRSEGTKTSTATSIKNMGIATVVWESH